MSPWHVGAGGRERPSYPEYEAEFGEDPARWLFTRDPDGIAPGSTADTPELHDAVARIRGIQDVALLDAWLDVETDLPFGPRKPVVKAINRRRAELTGKTDDADLSLAALFPPAAFDRPAPTVQAADGGRVLPPGSPWVCDECRAELDYLRQGKDARGDFVDVLECPTPECDVGEVTRR